MECDQDVAQPATVQRILRHRSITVTTGTYIELIAVVQRDALDSMGTHWRRFEAPIVVRTVVKRLRLAPPNAAFPSGANPDRSWVIDTVGV